MLGDNPLVSPEQFTAELWNLHPFGEPESTYIEVACALRDHMQFDGNKLTFVHLVERYHAYLKLCQHEIRELRYIKHIKNFVRDRMYNQTFEAGDNPAATRYL